MRDMTSDKVNSIKNQLYTTTSLTMSADVPSQQQQQQPPPPPYSSLYPPTITTTSPYGPIPMTSAAATFAPFYHQNGSITTSGPPPPPPQLPPHMIGTQLMATHPSTIGPHHHQMYGTIGPNNYIPATAQPYGLYQTAVIPTAYGPMIAPIQFPPMTNAAAAAAAAASMMIPTTNTTAAAATTDPYFDPRNQHHHSRAFEIEMARQTIPIPPFGHIPPVVPSGNMALMYGAMGNGNGTMLVSKPLKKPFY
nr:lysine-rich arabinogalactan protein 19-like isoform X1 [Dermatophagoides farinae]